mgnify:CR=1 FL=1
MDDQKPKKPFPQVQKLETQYKNLQARKDRALLNNWTESVKEIEAKMDKVSEKMVRALVKRQKKV